jgi:protocatechuate 3,4-dioxygenase beta subunit
VDETIRELDEAATITVTVIDTNGDPMADQVVSFTETGGTLSPTSCTTGADGTCFVELTNTDVGDVDVTASVAEGDIDTVTVTFIDTPVLDLMASTLAVDSDLWEVDQTATITATVVDTKGRAMSDQRVDFQIDSGVGDLSDDYCITGVDGKCTVTLTSDTPGDVEVSSSIDGDPMGNVTVTFTPERVPDPDESSMTLSTTTATVGGTVVITIEVKDEDGLPLAGKDVTLDADNGAVLSKTTCTSGADGTCTATLTTSTVGDVVVTATLATGKDITGSPETVTFNPPPPAISTSFKPRYVGETQTVTGTNFIPGETVTLVVTSDPWEVGDEVADANGNVSFDFVIPPSMAPASASETHTATLTGSTSGPYSGTFQVLAATTAAPGGKAAVPTGGTVSTATPLILLSLGLTLACAAVSLRRVGIDS